MGGYIGENIKRYREAAGLSQSELARRIDRVPSLISAYEAGRAMPSWETMVRMAGVLGVTSRDLVDDRKNRAESADDTMEEELLALFRRMPPEKREQLIRIASSL